MSSALLGGAIAGAQVAQTLLRKPFRTTITKVDLPKEFITFDATMNSTHRGGAELTDHPVERGSDITDHIRRLPEVLDLNVIVTDTPVLLLPALRAKPAVEGGDINKRSAEAWKFLVGLKDTGTLVNVSTKLRDYINMAIVDLSVTQDKDTSNIIAATISLREIIIANTESQPIEDGDRKREQNLGKKTKRPARAGGLSSAESLVQEANGVVGIL